MAFLDEQGLQRLADKINVRASSTLPNNAPDGTIIINPDEDTEIFNVDNINIDVDSALSLTSTNPVQNKVVTKELERIPCKLTVRCVGFDGGEITNFLNGASLSTAIWFKDSTFDVLSLEPGVSSEFYLPGSGFTKVLSKGSIYSLMVNTRPSDMNYGEYYDPDIESISNAAITEDTDIVITFRKKREPITLTINLKDKNGNFVSDDVIVTDSFNNTTTTVGTYGKTPGEFTIQVTKGYEYTITPSLKGYNNKENNSPADPNKTTITQTSTEDTVIDIVYNKIYPIDFGTDWASFHAQIVANPGTEVLPIGTELSTTITDSSGSDTTQVKFHIVNWRYADKEDGSQVWGCDLLTTQMEFLALSFYKSGNEGYSWEDSQIRSAFNDDRFIGLFESNFANHIQKVKVTSGNYKNTPVYTYDNIWLPSGTEMYINTAATNMDGSIRFTKVVEGNNNEKYWKNIMGASSKFDPKIANRELIFSTRDLDITSNMYKSQPTPYWLRSCVFVALSTPSAPGGESNTDENYTYNYNIHIVSGEGAVEQETGTNTGGAIRPMCFFA